MHLRVYPQIHEKPSEFIKQGWEWVRWCNLFCNGKDHFTSCAVYLDASRPGQSLLKSSRWEMLIAGVIDQSPLSAVRVIFSYKSDLRFWVWHCCNIIYLLHSCTFFFVCRRARAGTKKVLLLVLCFLSKSKRWIMAFFYQADPDWMLLIPRFMSIIRQIMNTPQMLVCYYAWG